MPGSHSVPGAVNASGGRLSTSSVGGGHVEYGQLHMQQQRSATTSEDDHDYNSYDEKHDGAVHEDAEDIPDSDNASERENDSEQRAQQVQLTPKEQRRQRSERIRNRRKTPRPGAIAREVVAALDHHDSRHHAPQGDEETYVPVPISRGASSSNMGAFSNSNSAQNSINRARSMPAAPRMTIGQATYAPSSGATNDNGLVVLQPRPQAAPVMALRRALTEHNYQQQRQRNDSMITQSAALLDDTRSDDDVASDAQAPNGVVARRESTMGGSAAQQPPSPKKEIVTGVRLTNRQKRALISMAARVRHRTASLSQPQAQVSVLQLAIDIGSMALAT